MWRSLLGLDNDDSELINQPTIDYNTISSPSKQPQQPKQNSQNNKPLDKPRNQTFGTVIDYSDVEEDDDDDEYLDLNNDIKTNTRLINQWRTNNIQPTTFNPTINQNGSINRQPTLTNVSLPDQYPGKFPHLKNDNDIKQDNSVNLLEADEEYESLIDAKIQALQREIDNNDNDNDNDNDNFPQNVETTNVLDEINNLQLKITSQTKTLQELNELVDVYEDEIQSNTTTTTTPTTGKLIIDYKDYQNLKNEYMNELNRVKKLYEAYYLLFNRYISLKRSYKQQKEQKVALSKKNDVGKVDKVDEVDEVDKVDKVDEVDEIDEDDKDPKDGRNGDTISIKEKINQIKSKTNDSSIKTICDTLLKDVTKLEKNWY